MKIGLTAYDIHPREFLDLAMAADEAGFESLWLGEHVVLPVGFASEHPTTDEGGTAHHDGPIVAPDTELVDPLVTLGAAAALTRRIRLATGIYVLSLRHPLATARSVATTQDLAGGRLVLGVGYGWLAEEFAALDVPFDQRVGRFEEALVVLRQALAGGPLSHEGRYHSFAGVQVTNRPTPVPLVLGGNGEKALRRAVRLGDGWFSSGTPPFDVALRLRDDLHRLLGAEGTDRPFEMIFRVEGSSPDTVERYAAAGIDHVLIWADQVWPTEGDRDTKRESLFAAAAALGLQKSDENS